MYSIICNYGFSSLKKLNMSGCCAANCQNSKKKGFRVFRFPSENREKERRKKWIQNCRRDKWSPTAHSVLCEIHFEDSQFEQHRADGRRLLSPCAIPTIFNVPNPPPTIDYQRKSLYKKREPTKPPIPAEEQLAAVSLPTEVVQQPESCAEEDLNSLSQEELIEVIHSLRVASKDLLNQLNTLKSEIMETRKKYEGDIIVMKKSIHELESELTTKREMLGKFLNKDQMKSLTCEKMSEWSSDSVIKGLKFRYMLGVRGYQFLHSTGYPIPSYSTLNRRVECYKVNTGVLENLLGPLKAKVECMGAADKLCSLSVDEMMIASGPDYDKHRKQMFGHVTLGNDSQPATHILLALVRGIRNNWKQVIAVEFTSSKLQASDLKAFVENCIQHVENAGLRVVSFVSDMGSKNVAFWSEVGVACKRDGTRQNSFVSNGHPVFILPDTCHLLKNLKSALLAQDFVLPIDVVEKENLPSNTISSKFIRSLWNFEVNSKKSLRLLHHLRQEDLMPSNFEKMRVGPAVRFFSTETSAALKTAIMCKLLPEVAHTTAWFVQLISDWFTLVSSRIRKKSITRRNKEKKTSFLLKFMYIFEQIQIGNGDKWKPLNTGMVMSTISILDLSRLLLRNEANLYEFLLLSRFNQDSLENVFSQIRLRAGMTPTPTQCLTAIKTITLSQFISDVKRSNYCDASDKHLLDHFSTQKEKKMKKAEVEVITPLSDSVNENIASKTLKTAQITDPNNLKILINYDLCLIYNISGCVTNALLKQKFCSDCKEFILKCNLSGGEHFKIHTKNLDKGGLKYSNLEIFSLVLNCSLIFDQFMEYILHNNLSNLVTKICDEIAIPFPRCYCTIDMKKFVVDHFFKIKLYGVCSVEKDRKRKKIMYGTSAPKRKKI